MKNIEHIYQCPICEFRYQNEKTAKRCEAWCREHQSCNMKIIKESIEGQKTKEAS